MTAPKPRRRTFRFAIVAVACLLLGAVTTVGVAWCGELYWPDEQVVRRGGGTNPGPPRWEPRGERLTHYMEVRSWGRQTEAWTGGEGVPATEIHRTGWPALAMWRRKTSEDMVPVEQRRPGLRFAGVNEGIRLLADLRFRPGRWMMFQHGFMDVNGRPNLGYAHLPLRPLFPGFALDTALYALAWYLLIFTPLPLIRAGRRRFRVSRGMCGSCGYDLSASTARPCPECGA